MPEVLNAREIGWDWRSRRPDAVYVGRPTKWGNPFIIGRDGTREEVVEKYRHYLLSNPDLIWYLPELAGKDLICWCAPEACHADVLLHVLGFNDIQPKENDVD